MRWASPGADRNPPRLAAGLSWGGFPARTLAVRRPLRNSAGTIERRMPMFKQRYGLAAALALAVGLHPTAGNAQDIEILMALPAPTLTFSSAFIAEDAGFYKKEGLKVSHRILVGVASPNAV